MPSDKFGHISEVDPDNPVSWEGRIFLTFDIDWAHDAVIADTIRLVEPLGIKATWFVTHDSPLLAQLRANPNFELGIHPNFNFLLNGDPRNGATAEEVVDRLLEIVPEARCVRSHALTQGTTLNDLFVRKRLTHDSNHHIPEQIKAELRPWHWLGLIKAPYFWEDGLYCRREGNSAIEDLLARPGIRIFDFHPIHVYLNTEDMARYQSARPFFADPAELLKHRHQGGSGSRDFLIDLLEKSR